MTDHPATSRAPLQGGTAKPATLSNSPLQSELRAARQCAALLSLISTDLGGVVSDSRERSLLDIAVELADRIYNDYWHVPAHRGTGEGMSLSGQLSALVSSLPGMHDVANTETDDDVRDQLVSRIAWLQVTASDIAQRLVVELETPAIAASAVPA